MSKFGTDSSLPHPRCFRQQLRKTLKDNGPQLIGMCLTGGYGIHLITGGQDMDMGNVGKSFKCELGPRIELRGELHKKKT